MENGWAIMDSRGRLLIRTVSDTRRSAIVNWLCTEAGLMATRFAFDEQIEQAWQSKKGDAEAVEVSIAVVEHA